jgi:hypothetical protein
LAPIAAASEGTGKPPILLFTELPQFEASYIINQAGAFRHVGLSE